MNSKYLVFNTYNLKFSVHFILPNNDLMCLDISHEEALRLKGVLGIRIQGIPGIRNLIQKGTEPQKHEIYWDLSKPHSDFWENSYTGRALLRRGIDFSNWSDTALLNWTIDIGAQLTEEPDPQSEPDPNNYYSM